MDTEQLNKKLHLIALKNKLLYKFKNYLLNIEASETHGLDEIFRILKEKYATIDNGFNFVESIRINIGNNGQFNKTEIKNNYYIISSIIYGYNNKELLEDFLMCIDVF